MHCGRHNAHGLMRGDPHCASLSLVPRVYGGPITAGGSRSIALWEARESTFRTGRRVSSCVISSLERTQTFVSFV